MRTSFVHYIAPSAISITPNCNDSGDDLAVYLARNAKIRVFSKEAGIDMAGDTFQDWSIKGRNRRLGNSDAPYTIYARLSKTDKSDGYLVFAEKRLLGWEKINERLYEPVYVDKYSCVTMSGNGLSVLYKDKGFDVQVIDEKYWYIRLGDVAEPVGGKRTVTLDTGILGTDRFNTEWELNPDALPLRVELSCAIGGKDVGSVPYVAYGQSVILAANLVEGWNTDANSQVHHWIIERNTGNDDADAAWNFTTIPATDTSEEEVVPKTMPSGRITIDHLREAADDFGGAVAATFTVTAMGENAEARDVAEKSELIDDPEQSESSGDDEEEEYERPKYVILAATKITMLAEAVVSYGLDVSSNLMIYNPLTETYFPQDGIVVRVFTRALGGMISYLTDEHIAAARLHIFYGTIDDHGDTVGKTELIVTGGEGLLDTSLFSSGRSLFVWLENGSMAMLAYAKIDYMSYSGSIVRSMMFVRFNGTPQRPVGGSFSNPSPSGQIAGFGDDVTIYWQDGIPDGDMQIWCSQRIFTSDGQPPQQAEWSAPQLMSDTTTYDVEFAKKQANDAIPDEPDAANRHGGDGEQVWFDPSQDEDEDFTQMYWRAERECRNGVWGGWVIVRIKGERGDNGTSGSTPINVYAWNQSPTLAPGIISSDPTPSGWSATPPDRPDNGYFLWMSTTMLSPAGTISGWSTPVRISGDTGTPGEDSGDTEWIYNYANSFDGEWGEVNPAGAARHIDSDQQQDGWVPYGWYNHALSVSKANTTLYASWRTKPAGNDAEWGPFQKPIVWSHYGRNGMDGDGVEYVFIRTKTSDAVLVLDSSGTDSNGRSYTSDEYLPAVQGGGAVEKNEYASRASHPDSDDDSIGECSDEPKGVSDRWPYEWVLKRTKAAANAEGVRTWGRYDGEMALWATYSESISKASEAKSYQVSTSGVTTPEGEWYGSRLAAVVAYNNAHGIHTTVWQADTWMWERTVISWSDGSTTTLYTQDRNPDDGINGQNAYIVSQTVDYAVSANNNTPPTSGWGTYASIRAQLVAGRWLWTRTTVTYNTGDPQVSYSTSYIARDGEAGAGLGENLIDNSEAAETFNVADSEADNNGRRFYRTAKSYESYIMPPDGTKVSGQMRITLDGCSLVSDSHILLYCRADNAWPYIAELVVSENGTYDVKWEGKTTLNANGGTWDGYVYMRLDNFGGQGTVTLSRVKLEVGEKCTAWSLSEHDKMGRGVSAVTEHYLASAQASGVATPENTDWDVNPQPEGWGKDAKYLWNYEKITYSDGTIVRTAASIVALWTRDGRGIDSIVNYYLATSWSENVTRANGEYGAWTTAVQPIDENKPYLWNYELITWIEKDSVTRTQEPTAPHIIGHYGRDGLTHTISISADGYWVIDGVKQSTRAEGRDGKGVEIKGEVDTVDDLPDNGNSAGDCYIVSEDRHLYIWTGDGWNDLGEFRGEDGRSSYMHIAYANNIIYRAGTQTVMLAAGFTVNNNGSSYPWIGFCTDDSEDDPGRGAATIEEQVAAARRYKWNYQKGADGTSAFVVDIDNQMVGIPVDSNGATTADSGVTVNLRAFYGTTAVIQACTVTPETEDENIEVIPSATTAGQYDVHIDPDVRLADVNNVTFTVTHPSYGERQVVLTLNAVRPGAEGEPAVVYDLQPSVTQINVGRTADGGYAPASYNLTCGYTKSVGGSITTNANATAQFGDYGIVFRLRRRDSGNYERYWLYSQKTGSTINARSLLYNFNAASYDAIELLICDIANAVVKMYGSLPYIESPSGIIDRETVPVVADGQKGDTPEVWEIRTNFDTVTYHRDSDGEIIEGTQYIVITIVENIGTPEEMDAKTANKDYRVITRFSYTDLPAGTQDGNDYLEYEPTGGIPVPVTRRNVYIAIFDDNGTRLQTKTVGIISDGPLGPGGPQGKDSYSVSVMPAYAIFEQKLLQDGTLGVDVSQWAATVNINKDGAPQPFQITQFYDENCVRDLSNTTPAYTTVSTAYVKFAQINTATDSDGNQTHYSQGSIQMTIQTTDGKYTQNVKIPFYVNLIGAFMRTVNQGVETAIGNLTRYVGDIDGRVKAVENTYEEVNSAVQSVTTLTTRVNGLQTDVSTIKQTSSEINMHVVNGWKNYIVNPLAVDGQEGTHNDEAWWIFVDSRFGTVIRTAYSYGGNWQLTYALSDDIGELEGQQVTWFFVAKLENTDGGFLHFGSGTAHGSPDAVCVMFSRDSSTQQLSIKVSSLLVAEYYEDISSGYTELGNRWYLCWTTAKIGASGIVPESHIAGFNFMSGTWQLYYGGIVKGSTPPGIDLIMQGAQLRRAGINLYNGTIDLIAGRVNFIPPDPDPDDDEIPETKISIDPTDGSLHAVDGVFSGTVKANLQYLPTKWFVVTSTETTDYYIDPVNKPYSCYAVETNYVLGYVNLYLPDPNLYDGLELKFFWLKKKWLGAETVKPMRICPGGSYDIWVYRSSDDDYVNAYVCYPLVGEVRIKAFGGRWVVIDGNFSYNV